MENTSPPILMLLLVANLSACNVSPQPPDNLIETQAAEFDLEKHLANYEQLKKRVDGYKADFTGAQNRAKAKKYLFHLVSDSIWPYWYGTEWDFNGITQTPRMGLIACGYFVTTTLRDAGVELQRAKLAQMAASDIEKKLCDPASIKTFTKMESLEKYLAERGDEQLYILGLDNHVGFVIRDKGYNYFVHADYTRDGVAKRESLAEALPVIHSKILMIGSILGNNELVDKWAGGGL